MVQDPALGNTYRSDDPSALPSAIGVREDLYDVISRISPTDTPFYSNSTKNTAKNTIFDWLVIELASPDTTNRNPEGFEATIEAARKPTRLNNHTQILAKTGSVSGTMESVDKAGRAKEYRYQQMLKGLEIRRDLEAILTFDQAKDPNDPRAMGSFSAYVTNVSQGATAAPPAGDGTDVPTAGTPRDLSLTLIEDVMQLCYEEGGSPGSMYFSPTQKRTFSGLAGSSSLAAENRFNMTAREPATYIGAVDVFLTDFGTLNCVIDRFMPPDRVYLVDRDWCDTMNLPGRNFTSERLAKTGDSEKFEIVGEFSLRIRAPKAHGAIYDLT